MKKLVLFAPEQYNKLTPEQKKRLCNGCGAKGGISVPNTFYGLSMKECCNIHDFMYSKGRSLEDKNKADRVFLNNCVRTITAKSSWILKPLRLARAKEYYLAVKYFGADAFWSGKNDIKNKVTV
jgi:hypothetical protein